MAGRTRSGVVAAAWAAPGPAAGLPVVVGDEGPGGGAGRGGPLGLVVLGGRNVSPSSPFCVFLVSTCKNIYFCIFVFRVLFVCFLARMMGEQK